MGGGVTGSTTDFGSVSTGSSPVPPAMHPYVRPTVIVLAAGKGTRMESDLAKVLHRVAGRPMIQWVLDAVAGIDPVRTMVVLGHQAGEVAAVLPESVEWCLQKDQLGTAHAVQVALTAMGDRGSGPVLVVAGDMPLVGPGLLERLVDAFRQTDPAVALVTARVENTRGFGRVVRTVEGHVGAVIEERDADEATRAIREVNAGIYLFDGRRLAADLEAVRPDNIQGEYYLPDVIGMATARGDLVVAVTADEQEVIGINTLEQLEEAERVLRARVARHGYDAARRFD